MKIYTSMPYKLKLFYGTELQHAATALMQKQWQLSWRHLERAHILAQPYPIEHTTVHWKMLQFGIRIKNGTEILGQLPRLIFGGVKSFVGKIPVGNTGGADVAAWQPMPIPDDLTAIINSIRS